MANGSSSTISVLGFSSLLRALSNTLAVLSLYSIWSITLKRVKKKLERCGYYHWPAVNVPMMAIKSNRTWGGMFQSVPPWISWLVLVNLVHYFKKVWQSGHIYLCKWHSCVYVSKHLSTLLQIYYSHGKELTGLIKCILNVNQLNQCATFKSENNHFNFAFIFTRKKSCKFNKEIKY